MNKEELIQACEKIVSDRVDSLNQRILELQDAANQETKSSMGDKYETGRSMLQLETDKLSSQLQDARVQLKTLFEAKKVTDTSSIQFGSVFLTSKGLFFIAIGLGKVNIADREIFMIAPTSPLALTIIGKKLGSDFLFMNEKTEILEIW